jgi:uncharacterized protein (TIGR03435 family)
MNWKLIGGGASALTIAIAMSQSGPAARLPEFAVASVKPNKLGCCTTYGVGSGGGGGTNVTLKNLIALAYRLQDYQISGGPRWIGSDRFDVEGKAEDPKADYDQLRLMLRSLFEDRFKLKLHRETKQSAVYALVVGKGGPKIKLSADQVSPDVNGPAPEGAGPNRGAVRIGVGNLIGYAVPMSRLAFILSMRLDRLVIDKTNLAGRFDLHLRCAPDPGVSPFDSGGNRAPDTIIDVNGVTLAADPNAPSFFSAIQEQLGLKLESAKAPVDVLVIDHVEKPSEN